MLDAVKDELERQDEGHINSIQALMLFYIGGQVLSANELKKRGYYLGSNTSYNIKILVKQNYLKHERSPLDRRAVRLSLTEKGAAVAAIVNVVFEKHATTIQGSGDISEVELTDLIKTLGKLKRFWIEQVLYRR